MRKIPTNIKLARAYLTPEINIKCFSDIAQSLIENISPEIISNFFGTKQCSYSAGYSHSNIFIVVIVLLVFVVISRRIRYGYKYHVCSLQFPKYNFSLR